MPAKLRRPLIFFCYLIFVWTWYRLFFSYPEWIDEFLFKPLLMLIPTILLVTIIERKSLSSLGLTTNQFFRNVGIGLGVGGILIGELVVVSWIKDGSVILKPNNTPWQGILLIVSVSLATGFVEEVVYRGYFFTRFLTYYKDEIRANTVSSLLFVGIHLPIFIFFHKYSLSSMIPPLLQLSIMSLINGFLLARTKSVVTPVITHAMWNAGVLLIQ